MDKVQRIKGEIKRQISNIELDSMIGLIKNRDAQKKTGGLRTILSFIETLEKEPEPTIWHDSNKEQPKEGSSVLVKTDSFYDVLNNAYEVFPDQEWTYLEDLLKKE